MILGGEKQNQFFIPEGFAHGFLVLNDNAIFAYKCTDFITPEDEGGIIWQDSVIGIDWLSVGMKYLLSKKDLKFPIFVS